MLDVIANHQVANLLPRSPYHLGSPEGRVSGASAGPIVVDGDTQRLRVLKRLSVPAKIANPIAYRPSEVDLVTDALSHVVVVTNHATIDERTLRAVAGAGLEIARRVFESFPD